MHIPDGFLGIGVSAAMYALAIAFWVPAFRRAGSVVGDRHVPFLAVLAAAIFGCQMLNFTLLGVGGTSGHLLGAALAAIIMGPYGALIIMTLVLFVQALFFADGGVTALGANIVNMGVVGGFAAYMAYTLLRKSGGSMTMAAAIAAWLSVVAASFACALQLAASGTAPAATAMVAMVPVHAIIGLGEAFMTVGILKFIQKTRPDLLRLQKIAPRWLT
ncbi:MAG: energy-coupling factor ABC transporter permease [archaeon]